MSTTETQTPQIHARLAAVLAGVEAIGKDRKSGQDGYGPKFSYRGVDDVYNELHGLFAKHRIYLSPEVVTFDQKERQTDKGKTQIHAVVQVRYTFTADDGSSTSMTMVGEAADSGDKSLGKAVQYAIKVLLLQAFLIPTEGDNDPDARSVEWGANQQRQPAQRRDTKPQSFREEYEQKPPAEQKPDWMGLIAKARSRVEIEGVRVALDAALRKEGAPPRDNPKVRATLAALDAKEAELSIGGAG